MKKEILLAIIAGGGFGLIIAFGIWKLNANLKLKNNNISSTSSPSSTATNTPEATQVFKIILSKPNNMQVITDTPTAVSGITKPNAYVAVSGEDADYIGNASSSGSFNSNVDLAGGANQIVVTAFDVDGSETQANLLIVYSSQFTASSSAEPQAYIGTVTDISNSVIQIKNDSGDIEQISGIPNANYIDTRNNVTKQIKASDVAIGDYLIAMGTKDGNNILTSSRVLITETLTKTTRQAFYGVVTDDSGINKFTAKNPKTGEIITVTPATGIQVSGEETSFGKISNDEKIIAVGELKGGTLTARTILVLK